MQDLLQAYRKVWAVKHATSLLHWDQETYMPPQGAKARGMAEAELALLSKELTLSLKPLVQKYEKREDLDDFGKGVIRVLKRSIDYYEKIPERVIVELTSLLPESHVAWVKAKEKNDFEAFRPYLEKIVALERQVAEAWGYEREPYDALLDLHEEGLRASDVESIFSRLLPALKDLVGRQRFPSRHELEEVKYRKEDMERANREVLDLIGFPWDRFRVDESAHPFTISMSVDDVRITTRYEGVDFKRTLFSVVHEGGHAMYDMNVDRQYEGTPVGKGVSLGVHEGQSRFWENVVGRSREFVELVYPVLKRHLDFMGKYSPEEIYEYFNVVKPSLIRVDADELTYNFHIAVRFEIERKLINEGLEVKEVPSLWDDLYEKYLGVRPKTFSEGVLQDVHWSGGSFGYFPTYTLGNIVAAMSWKAMPKLGEMIASRDFEGVKSFLREKIWRWGSVYEPKELLRRAYGKPYDVEALVEYLEWKFAKR